MKGSLGSFFCASPGVGCSALNLPSCKCELSRHYRGESVPMHDLS